jgi:hypothetical protein
MVKLELNLFYKGSIMLFIKIIFIFFITLSFQACFSSDDKETRQIDTVKKQQQKQLNLLINKVKQTKDSNKTLSEQIEEDGIVIDGARDEELLDSFNLAVSQVMMEEGVSVPDCTMLSKTDFLTKDECDEISEKYFGFYDIYGGDGEIKKVDDVFAEGILGDTVEIRNEKIKYFDSSGNPLLENQIEFDELVDNSNDLEMLKDLELELGDKEEMKNRIKEKIRFLTDMQKNSESIEQNSLDIEEIIKQENGQIQQVEEQEQEQYLDNTMSEGDCMSKRSALRTLKIKLKDIEVQLDNSPDNNNIIDQYNIVTQDINNLESEVAGCL